MYFFLLQRKYYCKFTYSWKETMFEKIHVFLHIHGESRQTVQLIIKITWWKRLSTSKIYWFIQSPRTEICSYANLFFKISWIFLWNRLDSIENKLVLKSLVVNSYLFNEISSHFAKVRVTFETNFYLATNFGSRGL